MTFGYDSTRRITSQNRALSSPLPGAPTFLETYQYDNANRLVRWTNDNGDTIAHGYDAVGNRTSDSGGVVNGSVQLNSSYGYGGTGPNHLAALGSRSFECDPDGALIKETAAGISQEKRYVYSYRNLLRQYAEWSPQLQPSIRTDWRYRYSPSSERQQKRMYTWHPTDTLQHARGWVSYQLGGSGEQLSVWHGLETTDTLPFYGQQPNAVYMYSDGVPYVRAGDGVQQGGPGSADHAAGRGGHDGREGVPHRRSCQLAPAIGGRERERAHVRLRPMGSGDRQLVRRHGASGVQRRGGGPRNLDAMQQDTLPPFDYLQEYSLALGYDAAGRISSQDMIEHPRLLGGPGSQLHQQYRYDHAGRLARWINTAGDTVAYSYDAVGNRLADSIGVINGSLVLNHSYGYGGTGPNHLAVAGSYNYEYDPDGALIRKIYTGQPQEDRFAYSYRNLLRQYAEWSPQLQPEVYLDWRYRYSPAGQRQQKRLYTWNGTDTLQHARAWVYYLLGGSGEQLSVWHGVESTDTLPCGLAIPNTVYMYPVEYLSYGQETAYTKEDLARLITRPDAIDTTGIKEFRFADHDGSLRFSVDESGQVRTYDYDPWGAVIASSAGDTARRGFNDAEEDRENSTFDLGVRHYDEGLGRFLSVDPLMAKSPSVSPYVYSSDDPVNFTDPSGMQRSAIVSPQPAWETMPLEGGGGSDAFGNAYPASTEEPRTTDPTAGVLDEVGRIIRDQLTAHLESLAIPPGIPEGPGIVAKDGTRIRGFTRHGIDRMIGDDLKRSGVNERAFMDAIRDPERIINGIDNKGRSFRRFIGREANVTVNPETGRVVSVNPTSGGGVR